MNTLKNLFCFAAFFCMSAIAEEFYGGEYEHLTPAVYDEGDEYGKKDNYHFEYTIHDPQTDDYQAHQQVKEGGVVKGYYTLKEADGSLREVYYTADHEHGFRAVVTKNGKQVDPQPEQQPSTSAQQDYGHY